VTERAQAASLRPQPSPLPNPEARMPLYGPETGVGAFARGAVVCGAGEQAKAPPDGGPDGAG
jgi:hypothetical protein